MDPSSRFELLFAFLERLPAIQLPAGHKSIGSGLFDDGNWWVKFSLDRNDPLAWRVVQEFAHVLNDVSLEHRLPTVFKPASPPPYLNGGVEYLSWVIETVDPTFTPANCAEWLKTRLPDPVSERDAWRTNDAAG